MVKRLFALLIGVLFVCTLSSCSVGTGGGANSSSKSTKSGYPKTREERQSEKMGKIGGSDGLLNKILGLTTGSKTPDGTVSVDGYLWRAVIDTTYKLPIAKIDPKYGILMTDWHTLPNRPDVRYKMNIYITSDKLHADSIRVCAFKERKVEGQWIALEGTDALARDIEERILFRARALKVSEQ